MSLYDQIIDACNKGKYPVVRHSCGLYKIISPHTDETGRYRESLGFEEKKDCKYSIGMKEGCSTEEWKAREKSGVKIVGFHVLPVEHFKAGDLVDIPKEEFKHADMEGMSDEKIKMIGGVGFEIKGTTDSQYWVCTKDRSDYWIFSHDKLVPHIPKEKEEMTVEEICKELGRDIVIVKK